MNGEVDMVNFDLAGESNRSCTFRYMTVLEQ